MVRRERDSIVQTTVSTDFFFNYISIHLKKGFSGVEYNSDNSDGLEREAGNEGSKATRAVLLLN